MIQVLEAEQNIKLPFELPHKAYFIFERWGTHNRYLINETELLDIDMEAIKTGWGIGIAAQIKGGKHEVRVSLEWVVLSSKTTDDIVKEIYSMSEQIDELIKRRNSLSKTLKRFSLFEMFHNDFKEPKIRKINPTKAPEIEEPDVEEIRPKMKSVLEFG